jgi:hypothetical protein
MERKRNARHWKTTSAMRASRMTTNQICAAALVGDSDAPAGLNKRDLGKKHE